MKQFFSLLLALALVWSTFSVNAAYFTEEELTELEQGFVEKCDEIRDKVMRPEYFDGGCAEWVSDQLIHNDIGYWYNGYYNYGFDDGNKWFAQLDEGAVTMSRYKQVKYPGENALYDIVSEFGGYPVYNVVASWPIGDEEWESAGHVVYIWCIYEGYVYYADTFDQFLHKAGHIIKQPLDDFVKIYAESSGAMIGAVHFEGKEAVHYSPDESMFSQYTATVDCALRSAPILTVNGEDTLAETAPAGTVFTVKGAYTDEAGDRWLKIDGGYWVAYSDTVKNANFSTLGAENVSYPLTWCYHQGFTMTGTVISKASALTRVSVTISNEAGEVLVGGDREVSGSSYSVSELDETTYFEHFAPGEYRYRIIAENQYESATLLDKTFTVLYGTYKDSVQEIHTDNDRSFSSADLDMSGGVDAADFDAALQVIRSGEGNYFSDVNGDGVLNLTDLYRVSLEMK